MITTGSTYSAVFQQIHKVRSNEQDNLERKSTNNDGESSTIRGRFSLQEDLRPNDVADAVTDEDGRGEDVLLGSPRDIGLDYSEALDECYTEADDDVVAAVAEEDCESGEARDGKCGVTTYSKRPTRCSSERP